MNRRKIWAILIVGFLTASGSMSVTAQPPWAGHVQQIMIPTLDIAKETFDIVYYMSTVQLPSIKDDTRYNRDILNDINSKLDYLVSREENRTTTSYFGSNISYQTHHMFFDDFVGYSGSCPPLQMLDWWRYSYGGNGCIVHETGRDPNIGGHFTFQTALTIDSFAGIDSGGGGYIYDTANNSVFETRVRNDLYQSPHRFIVGFCPACADVHERYPSIYSFRGAVFMYDSSKDPFNWVAKVGNGTDLTSHTEVITPLAVDWDDYQTLRIELSDNVVRFYVDGLSAANITSSIPNGSVGYALPETAFMDVGIFQRHADAVLTAWNYWTVDYVFATGERN